MASKTTHLNSQVEVSTRPHSYHVLFLGQPQNLKSRWKMQAQVNRQFVNSTRKRQTALPIPPKHRQDNNKIERLNHLLFTLSPDFIILTEHGLNELTVRNVRLVNYTLVKAFGRKDRLKGGVAVFKHNRVENDVVKLELENISIPLVCEISGASVIVKKKNRVDILGVYRPPNASAEVFDEALNVISTALELLSGPLSIILLIGDVNIDCAKLSKEKQYFEELLARFNMTRLSLPATRITPNSATSIDAICSNLNLTEIKYEILHRIVRPHWSTVYNQRTRFY